MAARMHLTRDQAREEFERHKIKYRCLTRRDIELLHALCVIEVDRVNRAHETSISDSLRMSRKIAYHANDDCFVEAHLYVNASYFRKRQAISLEPNGFIGFAGWASDGNAQPFLRAFMRWCAILSGADR